MGRVTCPEGVEVAMLRGVVNNMKKDYPAEETTAMDNTKVHLEYERGYLLRSKALRQCAYDW